MNILSPGNFISIEYNINHGKKNEINKEMNNNNHFIIDNNENNNINYDRRDIQVKNDDAETQNHFQNKIKKMDEENKNIDIINSNNNKLVNEKKKQNKNFCFCCL